MAVDPLVVRAVNLSRERGKERLASESMRLERQVKDFNARIIRGGLFSMDAKSIAATAMDIAMLAAELDGARSVAEITVEDI
ncbi:hypothetical protein [Streptomyces sp. NPDC088727]|uniref:hypothetical protein n=1 Tax=Streptomyces sp. NPDC088727 TaxID=3365875 RepID=UPI0038209419